MALTSAGDRSGWVLGRLPWWSQEVSLKGWCDSRKEQVEGTWLWPLSETRKPGDRGQGFP